ncbi:hypothetical protein [Streptomyces sp. NPDC002611]
MVGSSIPSIRRRHRWVGGIIERGHAVAKARNFLLLLLLAAFTIRVLWLAVEPLLPFVVSGLAVLLVLGFIYHRMTRW